MTHSRLNACVRVRLSSVYAVLFLSFTSSIFFFFCFNKVMRLNARPITARRRLAMSYGVVSIPPPFPPSLCFSRSLYFSSFEIVMLVCFLLDIPSTSGPFSFGHIVYALRYHQRFLLDARLSSSSLDSLPPPSLFYLPCLLSSTESYSHFFFGRSLRKLFSIHTQQPQAAWFFVH